LDPNNAGGGGKNTGDQNPDPNSQQGAGGEGNPEEKPELTDEEIAEQEAAKLKAEQEAAERQKKKYSEADIQRIIENRLKQEKAQSEKKLATEKEEARKKALKEAGDFQTLTEELKLEVESLRPKAELAEKLGVILNNVINGEIENWPEEVKNLDPGDYDVEKRRDWLEKSRPLAKRLLQVNRNPNNEGGERNGMTPQQIAEMAGKSVVQSNPTRYSRIGK